MGGEGATCQRVIKNVCNIGLQSVKTFILTRKGIVMTYSSSNWSECVQRGTGLEFDNVYYLFSDLFSKESLQSVGKYFLGRRQEVSYGFFDNQVIEGFGKLRM